MSCLFRRSNGTWYVVYHERNRRRWLSTGERCFGRAHKIFRTCPSGSDRRRPTTISGFLGELQACGSSNFSKGTAYLYRHSISNLIKIVGDKPIRFVSVKDVEHFKTARSKNVSPVSVNVEFRTLRAAFNTALRWGTVSQNVFTQSKQLRVPIKEPAYLTKEEFASLLHFLDEDDFRDLLFFTVSTMMRRAEIVNLEWKDIDFERRLINVRSKDDFRVKGLRPRVIPMSDAIYQFLLRRKRDYSLVFVTSDGCKLKGGSISKKFKRYTRKCGLSDKIHFHSLRHSGATWLIQRGVPLYSVQKILGHTTPEMTQVYSHLSDQNLRQAIEQIDFYPTSIAMN